MAPNDAPIARHLTSAASRDGYFALSGDFTLILNDSLNPYSSLLLPTALLGEGSYAQAWEVLVCSEETNADGSRRLIIPDSDDPAECRVVKVASPVVVNSLGTGVFDQEAEFSTRIHQGGRRRSARFVKIEKRGWLAGKDGSTLPYILMEFVPGTTLHERQRQPLTIDQRHQIISDLLSAAIEMKNAGVVHRDLKPENIKIVEEEGVLRTVILDFGIWKREGATATPGGTALYMDPADDLRHRNDFTCSNAQDLYAIAMMAYELLSGELPFQLNELDWDEICAALNTEDSGKVSWALNLLFDAKHSPLVPVSQASKDGRFNHSEFDLILNRALALNRADRFQSPEDFKKSWDEAMNLARSRERAHLKEMEAWNQFEISERLFGELEEKWREDDVIERLLDSTMRTLEQNWVDAFRLAKRSYERLLEDHPILDHATRSRIEGNIGHLELRASEAQVNGVSLFKTYATPSAVGSDAHHLNRPTEMSPSSVASPLTPEEQAAIDEANLPEGFKVIPGNEKIPTFLVWDPTTQRQWTEFNQTGHLGQIGVGDTDPISTRVLSEDDHIALHHGITSERFNAYCKATIHPRARLIEDTEKSRLRDGRIGLRPVVSLAELVASQKRTSHTL